MDGMACQCVIRIYRETKPVVASLGLPSTGYSLLHFYFLLLSLFTFISILTNCIEIEEIIYTSYIIFYSTILWELVLSI